MLILDNDIVATENDDTSLNKIYEEQQANKRITDDVVQY